MLSGLRTHAADHVEESRPVFILPVDGSEMIEGMTAGRWRGKPVFMSSSSGDMFVSLFVAPVDSRRNLKHLVFLDPDCTQPAEDRGHFVIVSESDYAPVGRQDHYFQVARPQERPAGDTYMQVRRPGETDHYLDNDSLRPAAATADTYMRVQHPGEADHYLDNDSLRPVVGRARPARGSEDEYIRVANQDRDDGHYIATGDDAIYTQTRI